MKKGSVADTFVIAIYAISGALTIFVLYYLFSTAFGQIDSIIGGSVDVSTISTNYGYSMLVAMSGFIIVIGVLMLASVEFANQVNFPTTQIVPYILMIPAVILFAHYLSGLFSDVVGQNMFTSTVSHFGSLLDFFTIYFVPIIMFFVVILGYAMYRSKT